MQIKAVNTNDLLTLNRTAARQQFNRKLPYGIDNIIDGEGTHLVYIVLYGHNMDAPVEFHHRCRVLIKVNGRNEPMEALLDIMDSDYQKLIDVDSIISAIKEGKS